MYTNQTSFILLHIKINNNVPFSGYTIQTIVLSVLTCQLSIEFQGSPKCAVNLAHLHVPTPKMNASTNQPFTYIFKHLFYFSFVMENYNDPSGYFNIPRLTN